MDDVTMKRGTTRTEDGADVRSTKPRLVGPRLSQDWLVRGAKWSSPVQVSASPYSRPKGRMLGYTHI
jgi:hypothetical protein